MSEIGELGLFEAMRDLESNAGINGNFWVIVFTKIRERAERESGQSGKEGRKVAKL